MKRPSTALLAAAALAATSLVASPSAAPGRPGADPDRLLWQEPRNIESRDLRHGAGGAHGAPQPPFTFVREKNGGTQPKFAVLDARGREWTVKLGPEAQPEIAASRLVWAAGYFTDEHYFVTEAHIANMPPLSRGGTLIGPGGLIRAARFQAERPDVKNRGRWSWADNPFEGTRELNGLKVLMMLVNNWDVRDENNRVVRVEGGQERYLVSDLGATFGRVGAKWERSKNDVHDYISSRFVAGLDEGRVRFHYSVWPRHLGVLALAYPPYVVRLRDISRAMQGPTVDDAAWVGALLARLSEAQLMDAFTSAGYDGSTAALYVAEVRRRIDQLTSLEERR